MVKTVNLLATENCEEFSSEEEDDGDAVCLQNIPNISSIKCAAHTLQLAVNSFVNHNEVELINRARQVVKELRKPNMRWVLKPYGIE